MSRWIREQQHINRDDCWHEDIVFPTQRWTKIGSQSKMKSASISREN
jgi:hypothetical protein